jgi:fucose permease
MSDRQAYFFRRLERKHRLLYGTLLLNFAFYGITLTILGATVPTVIRTFGWSYTLTGVVLAAGSVGYFTATFLTGMMLHLFSPRASMIAGLLIEGLGLFFFGWIPSPALNMALVFVVGVGQGITEVVTNYEVIELNGESGLMTLLHAFFCLGAAVGPFLVGTLMRFDLGWSVAYRVCGLLAFAVIVPFAVVPFDTRDRAARPTCAGNGPESSAAPFGILFDPLLLLSFVMILLYVGSEFGISNWISEYFVVRLGASPAAAAYMVSVLWSGILVGRVALAFSSRDVRQEILLLLCACGCTFFLFLTIVAKIPSVAGVSLFLTGLGYSGIYPLVMNIAGRRYRGGLAVGFISTGGGIGSFVFPFLLAFLADRVGLRGGFLFSLSLNCILVVSSLMMAVYVRRAQGASEPGETGRTGGSK